MTRPDDRADDDAPTAYARLASQTEVFTRTRPVAPVTRWAGWGIVAAILVAVVVAVRMGSPW